MGVRGELFSTKVALQNRTYFFNVKENRLGDLYLNIVESKNRDEGGFDRQSVILFADDLQDFLQGFDESLRVMEKAVREKRRGSGTPGRGKETQRPREERPESPARQGRSSMPGGKYNRDNREAPPNKRLTKVTRRRPDRASAYGNDEGPRPKFHDRPGKRDDGSGRPSPGKRVVVKKR